MSKRKKSRKVEMKIEFDLDKHFFKVVDHNYNKSGGAMSGGYRDKEHFLDMFNDYFEKYICIELPECEEENESR